MKLKVKMELKPRKIAVNKLKYITPKWYEFTEEVKHYGPMIMNELRLAIYIWNTLRMKYEEGKNKFNNNRWSSRWIDKDYEDNLWKKRTKYYQKITEASHTMSDLTYFNPQMINRRGRVDKRDNIERGWSHTYINRIIYMNNKIDLTKF